MVFKGFSWFFVGSNFFTHFFSDFKPKSLKLEAIFSPKKKEKLKPFVFMYWNATVQFLVQFLYQKNILLMKYVQSNAADFEIPKLKIRIVHRYVRLLLKMTPKLNNTILDGL